MAEQNEYQKLYEISDLLIDVDMDYDGIEDDRQNSIQRSLYYWIDSRCAWTQDVKVQRKRFGSHRFN